MIKKILFWTFFAALIGLIVYGAIIRTNAKLEDASPANEAAQNQGQNEGNSRGQGSQQNESEHESEPVESLETPASGEDLTSITSSDSELTTFVGDSAHEWVTLTGAVAAVNTKTLTVTQDDGQTLLIERRPWRFAQETGFTTAPGNQLEIIGFYEDGLFQAAQIHDLTTGLLVRLRDETGHPLWASE